MNQAGQAVSSGGLFKDHHGQLVLVGGEVGFGVDRSEFMLGGSNFVMLGVAVNAEAPELIVDIFHESGYAVFDGAEIMVIQFLTFGSRRAEESSAGKA